LRGEVSLVIGPATFATSLYLLRPADSLKALIRSEYLDGGDTSPIPVDIAGHEGLLLIASVERDRAEWSAPLSQLTGVETGPCGSTGSSATLLIALDRHVFALTHGYSGRWMLIDEAKERMFGLRIAIRVLEPSRVRQLTRLALDVSARVDRTWVPGGQEVGGFGVERYADVVNEIGGRAVGLDLTYSRVKQVPVRLDGADALKLRIGVDPHDCVADLRTLLAALQRDPAPELAFIERVRRVAPNEARLARQVTSVGNMLSPGAAGPIGLAIPVDHADDEEAGRTYRITTGDVDEPVDEMSLEILQRAVSAFPEETRLDELHRGWVYTLPDNERLPRTRADRWLVAEVADGSSRFVFQQGVWYEVTGQEYLQALIEETRDIFAHRPDWERTLPPWTSGVEDAYLDQLTLHEGFIKLHPGQIKTLTQPDGFEPADVLGPNNELIHVKGTRSSALLSHLFNQGLVAADTLCSDPSAWDTFRKTIHKHNPDRELGDRPAAIVYAIHLKTQYQLAADTLFTFSKVALVRAHRHIRNRLNVPVAIAVIP
jgi:uncharacterized protein (TIGR04141 family)